METSKERLIEKGDTVRETSTGHLFVVASGDVGDSMIGLEGGGNRHINSVTLVARAQSGPVEAPANGDVEFVTLSRAYKNALEERCIAANREAEAARAELAALRSQMLQPATAAAGAVPFIEVSKVLDITQSDLQKHINAGWEKWHAEFKGDVLHVVLVRAKPAEPVQPQPEKAVVETPAEEKPAPKTVTPSAILPPVDDEPEFDPALTPAQASKLPASGTPILTPRALISAVHAQGAHSVIDDMNAHNRTRLMGFTAVRPQRESWPQIGASQ